MCRVLGVSRSGYHAWARRAPSVRALEDARLTERIREIHALNRKVYGSPRIHAELVIGDCERLGRKRVERLMRAAGLSGLVAHRRGRTTVRVPGVRVCETSSTALSSRRRRIDSGSPTSPTSEPGRVGCTWSPSRTSTHAGSSAGRWTITCAPNWSPTPCRWPCSVAGRCPD